MSYTRRSLALPLNTDGQKSSSSHLGLDLEVNLVEDLEVDLEVVDSVAEDLVAVDSVVEDLVGDLAMEDSVVLLVEKVAGVMGVEKTYPFWTP